jgi:hypothetical protein
MLMSMTTSPTHCTCTFKPLALLRTVAEIIETENGLADEANLIRSCAESLAMDAEDRALLLWLAELCERRAVHLRGHSMLRGRYESRGKRLREMAAR